MHYINPFRPIVEQAPDQPDPTSGDYADLVAANAQRPPVVVSLHVEAFGQSRDDTAEIERDEWDAMTPAERSELIDGYAEGLAANHVGWGWHINDPTDYAAATDEP